MPYSTSWSHPLFSFLHIFVGIQGQPHKSYEVKCVNWTKKSPIIKLHFQELLCRISWMILNHTWLGGVNWTPAAPPPHFRWGEIYGIIILGTSLKILTVCWKFCRWPIFSFPGPSISRISYVLNRHCSFLSMHMAISFEFPTKKTDVRTGTMYLHWKLM